MTPNCIASNTFSLVLLGLKLVLSNLFSSGLAVNVAWYNGRVVAVDIVSSSAKISSNNASEMGELEPTLETKQVP